MFYINYFLISFSILGYGVLFSKLLGLKIRNFGFIGFYGLSLLTFLSYLTAPFFVHSFTFNTFVLVLGLVFFSLILKEKINLKKNILNIFFITILKVKIIFLKRSIIKFINYFLIMMQLESY